MKCAGWMPETACIQNPYAVRDMERATNLNSENADYCNSLGNAYYGANDYDNAVRQYEKTISRATQSATYRRNLGNVYLDKGQPANAIRECIQAIELDPGN